MTEEALEQWQEDFDAFHARFADLFEREPRRASKPANTYAGS